MYIFSLLCMHRRKAFTDYIKTHNCACKVDNPAPVSKPAAAAASSSSSSSNTVKTGATTTTGAVDSHSRSNSAAVAAAAAAVPPELTAKVNEAVQLRQHVELVAAVKVLRDAVKTHPTEYAALTMYHQVSYS
jgi:hypothetical protein